MTRNESTAAGLGSGVVLVWLWNGVIGTAALHWLGWHVEMPGEVGAALSPVIIVALDRWLGDGR